MAPGEAPLPKKPWAKCDLAPAGKTQRTGFDLFPETQPQFGDAIKRPIDGRSGWLQVSSEE